MKEMGIAINELHHKAMALADEASYAKRGGELEVAQSKYLEAFEFEKAAAMLLVNEYSQELGCVIWHVSQPALFALQWEYSPRVSSDF